MNGESGIWMRWTVLAGAAVALLAAGAGGAYLVLGPHAQSSIARLDQSALAVRADDRAPASATGPAAPLSAATGDAPWPDVSVPIGAEAVKRAGILAAPAVAGTASGDLRLPGVVEANAYKQVAVTPLVSGSVVRVLVELGAHVRRGQAMAQIFSPQLAEARTRFTSARAELEAHEQELRRTDRLVEIGAASRQELDRAHAEHTMRTADVQSARSQLSLLGVPDPILDSAGPARGGEAVIDVPAPIDGVVSARAANVGLNVDPSVRLFTVVDLSTVWVVADVYEKDLARVRVGSPATVTTTAYPGVILRGRVEYIDPQLSLETRTAKARVEVLNTRGDLRLGMYAEVMVTGVGQADAIAIPKSAVQSVGDRHVVYLVNPTEPGIFVEREVRLGPSSGDRQEVSGLQVGDQVVATGSFFVRAERERLGLR